MLAFLLLFVVLMLSIPLYLDYKRDPKNNLVVNNLNLLNANIHVQNIIKPLIPHAEKHGLDKIFIFPVVTIAVLLLLILIIKFIF